MCPRTSCLCAVASEAVCRYGGHGTASLPARVVQASITIVGMALRWLVFGKEMIHLVGTPDFNSCFLITPTFPPSSPYARDPTPKTPAFSLLLLPWLVRLHIHAGVPQLTRERLSPVPLIALLQWTRTTHPFAAGHAVCPNIAHVSDLRAVGIRRTV